MGFKNKYASPLADLLAFRKVDLFNIETLVHAIDKILHFWILDLRFVLELLDLSNSILLILLSSPLFIYFLKIKARLGGRVRLIISGGAPLSSEIEEFLRVTCCAFVVQGYGTDLCF